MPAPGGRYATGRRSRLMRHTTVLLRTCLFLFALGLVAAQTASPSVSIDDPELYYGFFSLRMQMQRDISGISSESYVSTAGERQASLAQYLHLSEADFVRAGDVAKAVLARVGGVVDTARGYRTEEIAGLKVQDRAKLQAYQQQRTTIPPGWHEGTAKDPLTTRMASPARVH